MISQTRSYDWACKGRSAEMAAWQHLVLEEGQDDKPAMGRATALLDMTQCFEQVRLWHVWRWGMPLGFPESVAEDHPPGPRLSTPCGIVGLGVAARDNLRGHHRRFGLLSRHPPHAVHLALRLSDEQVAPIATDEVCGRPHDQLQRNEPHGRDSDYGGVELNGWLAGERAGLPCVER